MIGLTSERTCRVTKQGPPREDERFSGLPSVRNATDLIPFWTLWRGAGGWMHYVEYRFYTHTHTHKKRDLLQLQNNKLVVFAGRPQVLIYLKTMFLQRVIRFTKCTIFIILIAIGPVYKQMNGSKTIL